MSALTIAGSILLALVIGLGAWVVFRDTRQLLTLADVVSAESHVTDYAADAVEGLRPATDVLCDEVRECIEGYRSSQLELYRFATTESARRFASGKDGHHSDWIVVVYRGDQLTSTQRRELENLLDSLWASE